MKTHPYIITTIIASILAGIIWCCIPQQYTAIVVLSDEYKETDLSIGLQFWVSEIKQNLSSENSGINNADTYSRILKTDEFTRAIASVQVPGKGIEYGEWIMQDRHFWQDSDTLSVVSEAIEYNYSSAEIIKISFTDRDALVAAQMLDSTTEKLSQAITSYRQASTRAQYATIEQRLQRERDTLQKAQDIYTSYCDAHRTASRQAEQQKKLMLKNQLDRANDTYLETLEQHTRLQALSTREYQPFVVLENNTTPQREKSIFWVILFVCCLIAILLTKAVKLSQERRAEGARWDWGGVFSPWCLTLLVWGGMGILSTLSSGLLDPLTSQFYIAISLWIPLFVGSSFLTYNLLPHKELPTPIEGIEVNKFMFNLIFLLAVVLSPLYMYRVWQTVSVFNSEETLRDIRQLAVHGSGMGLLNYAIVISQSLLLVALWRYPKIPKWQLFLVMGCCLLNSVAIMEKGGIFLVILSGVYVLYERHIIRGRSILLIGAISFVGFYLFNIIRSGEDAAEDASILEFVEMYVLSPPVAFCRVRREISAQFGSNTFESIYVFLQRLGFNVEVHQKTQEFVWVPVCTNVYTIMQPFFRDFGYMGVAFFAALYGCVSGSLYRYARNGNAFAICFYTYMVMVLSLQFYQENMILSLVFVLQLLFFVMLMTQQKIRFKWTTKPHIQ